MPSKMTKEERAAYQREYRARQKAELQPGAVPGVETLVCGCQPGNLCISHAGSAMSQKDRDRILDRIPKTHR